MAPKLSIGFMIKLLPVIVNFLNRQNFVIVSSIDKDGFPHTSCKGMVDVSGGNGIYVFDSYKGNTYRNIKRNSYVSVTAVNEEEFKGYCIKGRARIISINKASRALLKKWEDKLLNRISRRIVKHIKHSKHSLYHPEADMPGPEYIIYVKAEKVISLAPSR